MYITKYWKNNLHKYYEVYFCKSFDLWKVQYNKLNAMYRRAIKNFIFKNIKCKLTQIKRLRSVIYMNTTMIYIFFYIQKLFFSYFVMYSLNCTQSFYLFIFFLYFYYLFYSILFVFFILYIMNEFHYQTLLQIAISDLT